MADNTPQKRVLPARERRGSVAKRRATTPVAQPSPATRNSAKNPLPQPEPRVKRKYTKRASLVKQVENTPDTTTPPPTGDILPTKLIDSKSLPVLHEKQLSTLSNHEYQSLADSAILAASLHRSRMQWLCAGIFKRYWVKPIKRKGVIEQPEGNPDVKTMQKLGNATITIEPHTFDATFYTVKDLTSIPPPPQRHPNQHTAKQPYQPYPPPAGFAPQPGMAPPHQNLPPPPVSSTLPQSQQPPSSSAPSQPKPAPSIPTTNNLTPQVKEEPVIKDKIPVTAAAVAPPGSTTSATSSNSRPSPAARAPVKPTEDPVIQMLAARAATDHKLKDLMKVVAMSQATPEQLREFQGHIDEFNKLIKLREAQKAEAERKSREAEASTTAIDMNKNAGAPYNHGPGMGGPVPLHPPPYMAYYPPPPRPEPIIKHIIVEFHSPMSSTQGATTDRWMFPEYAVLEMRTGGMEMIASFFAEKKGEDILKGVDDDDDTLRQKYDPAIDYFQPVTMLIKATQHRTIETIARAAKPLVEVTDHMKNVMEKQTRAPQEYLVHRLPRDRIVQAPAAIEFVDSGVEVSQDEDDELKDFYGI